MKNLENSPSQKKSPQNRSVAAKKPAEKRRTRRQIIEDNLRAIKRTRIAFAKW